MIATTTVEFHTRPYIRKYVLGQFADLQKANLRPDSIRLFNQFQNVLSARVINFADKPGKEFDRCSGQMLLELQWDGVLFEPPTISTKVSNQLNALLERYFRDELCIRVDFSRSMTRKSKKKAIQAFLNHYKINEDDIHFQSAIRIYWHHQKLRGSTRHYSRSGNFSSKD